MIKWNNVKDGTPEITKKVLVRFLRGDNTVSYGIGFYEYDRFQVHGAPYSPITVNATHWTEINEPTNE